MNNRDLEHLRTNSMIRFRTEMVNGHPVEIVSYMIGDKELWDDPAALETRGNAYDVKTGECICACFPKFFNVGERSDTQPDIVKDSFVEVFEKRDGSMVTPVKIDEKVYWKTKKSFFSEVALLAQSLVPDNIDLMAWGCLPRYTPIFEFTHPDTRIVLDYGNAPNFTLLAIRDNDTGEFLPWNQVLNFAKAFNIPVIKKYEKTWDELMHDVDHAVGIEGYVLVLKDGRRVKLKTRWYLEQHSLRTTLRIRDVAEAVVNETVDDFKTRFSMSGLPIDEIEQIEKQVACELLEIRCSVSEIAQSFAGQSIKDIAIALKGSQYFSLVMSHVRGKDPDYVGYWKRTFLNQYTLNSLLNSNF